MRARWYSPRLAQFTAPDALGYIDAYNLYGFSGFDPVNAWDPYGYASIGFLSAVLSAHLGMHRWALRAIGTDIHDLLNGVAAGLDPTPWGALDTGPMYGQWNIYYAGMLLGATGGLGLDLLLLLGGGGAIAGGVGICPGSAGVLCVTSPYAIAAGSAMAGAGIGMSLDECVYLTSTLREPRSCTLGPLPLDECARSVDEALRSGCLQVHTEIRMSTPVNVPDLNRLARGVRALGTQLDPKMLQTAGGASIAVKLRRGASFEQAVCEEAFPFVPLDVLVGRTDWAAPAMLSVLANGGWDEREDELRTPLSSVRKAGPGGWQHVIRRSGSAVVELLRFSHTLCRVGSVCSVPRDVLHP